LHHEIDTSIKLTFDGEVRASDLTSARCDDGPQHRTFDVAKMVLLRTTHERRITKLLAQLLIKEVVHLKSSDKSGGKGPERGLSLSYCIGAETGKLTAFDNRAKMFLRLYVGLRSAHANRIVSYEGIKLKHMHVLIKSSVSLAASSKAIKNLNDAYTATILQEHNCACAYQASVFASLLLLLIKIIFRNVGPRLLQMK
jgi:hypothetical protein